MGSNYYPFGPHGPRSDPNQVTPNPTPAYVPPPMSSPDSYGAPAPASYGGGGGYQGTYTYTPGPKHYWLAVILTFVFGPLGLFYASKKGALIMLLLLVGVPISLAAIGFWPGAIQRHPFSILEHSGVMDRMWSISVFFSVIWSVISVRRYNKAFKGSK